MADGTQSDNQGSAGSTGRNSVFVKGFLPGLLVGLVVGLTVGAVVPPLLTSRAPRIPEPSGSGSVEEGSRQERGDEREDAFEGTGLPFEEDDVEADASDAVESVVPPAD